MNVRTFLPGTAMLTLLQRVNERDFCIPIGTFRIQSICNIKRMKWVPITASCNEPDFDFHIGEALAATRALRGIRLLLELEQYSPLGAVWGLWKMDVPEARRHMQRFVDHEDELVREVAGYEDYANLPPVDCSLSGSMTQAEACRDYIVLNETINTSIASKRILPIPRWVLPGFPVFPFPKTQCWGRGG
ncbi:hypothetical protein ACFL6C_10190 [Myxococcota bacterium]